MTFIYSFYSYEMTTSVIFWMYILDELKLNIVELNKLNCKFSKWKRKAEFDKLDDLKDEFDELDKLSNKFDMLGELKDEFDEFDKLN